MTWVIAARRRATLLLFGALLSGASGACQSVVGLDSDDFYLSVDGCVQGEQRCTAGGTRTCSSGQWGPIVACTGGAPFCAGGRCTSVAVSGGFSVVVQSTIPGVIEGRELKLGGPSVSCAVLDGSRVCLTGGFEP